MAARSSGRPSAGRRPGAPGGRGGARPATRVSARPTRTTGSPAAPARPAAPRRSGLTGRAAVLVLVVGALLVSAALPVREYLRQRSQISQVQADQAAMRERVAELEAEKARLADPAYVASEARRRLQYVLPGEIAYKVILPSPTPGGDAPVGPSAPWYSQVWGSVQAADEPEPTPAP